MPELKYEKLNWLCMIFMLRRALFANEHSHIQEIADCHNFLLWSRVHRSLHSRQILVMKRMKIWDLIWCLWGLYLGISKLPINLKSENFVIQTVSSAETACSLAKAWQWWHPPVQPRPRHRFTHHVSTETLKLFFFLGDAAWRICGHYMRFLGVFLASWNETIVHTKSFQ